MAKRVLWNENWGFICSDYECVKELDFDASALERVSVPHDWGVLFPFKRDEDSRLGGFFSGGVGWYRKELYLSEVEIKKYRRQILLEGVFNIGTVYVNGEMVGSRPYGYFPAIYDITIFLKEGLNVVAVRVDDSMKEASRWYNGSGIFRNVYLIETGTNCIAHDGIWIRTPIVTKSCATVETRISVDIKQEINLKVRCEVRDSQGKFIVCKSEVVQKEGACIVELAIEKPQLWSTQTPDLYEMTVILHSAEDVEEEVDREQVLFGIRKLEWIPQQGFYLNGIPTKLKGVCLHHDFGITGTAAIECLMEQRLVMLKNMGCNAIRTSHNLQNMAFYDLCDRMGILVLDEAFDGWETAKARSDYGLYFKEWHQRDVVTWIKRDRNHPCIILWGIGNEVTDMTVETLLELKEMVQALDPDRPVTCGIQGIGEQSDACRAMLPVAGYNDGGGACFIYERDHKKRPNQLMVATESPHTQHTRGFYRTQTWWRDKNQPRKEIDNLSEEEIFFDGCQYYNSSYDNAGVRLSARDSWNQTLSLDYLIGEFRWIGFDYYGESPSWPARSVPMGVVDTANIPKDHYYLYQSMWLSKEEHPVLHMLPHWTHPWMKQGTVIPVWLYTNCDSVELFLNGNSLGRKEWRSERFIQYDVPYEPGKILAVARIGETIVREMSYQTAGCPQKLRLEWVNQEVCRKQEDLREIRASILDSQGTEVPHGESAITFWGTGYQILGTENGDHVDMTPLKSHVRKAFYGKCMVLAVENPDGYPQSSLYAASVLGERYFGGETEIAIEVLGITTMGVEVNPKCQICYRINGGEEIPYSGTFSINKSCYIEAEIRMKDQPVQKIRGEFIKGERVPYCDMIHGNREVASSVPLGPFSAKMAGLWEMEGQLLEFCEDGVLELVLSADSRQKVGYWWYDFPIDAFEAQEYAGTGEIWFLSGERAVVNMENQAAETVLVDNREFGFHTFYEKKSQLILKKHQK